jgi:hypothetical protein
VGASAQPLSFLKLPISGQCTGVQLSQAGLVSGGGTLIGVANLETHFLAHLSGYNSRPWPVQLFMPKVVHILVFV